MLTEDRLQSSEALRDMAVSVARLGGWAVDLATRHVLWTDEVCAIHEVPRGFSPSIEEAIENYAPEWRARIREVFDACVLDGTPFDEELQILTATGKRVWVRTIGHAVRGANDEITHIQGAFQEITDRKQVELERSALASRLTTILESITDGFFTLDRDWRFTYLNREAERILLRPRAELIGRNVWAEFPEAVDTIFYREYHRAMRDRVPVKFEAYYAPLKGWFELHAYPSDEGLTVYVQDRTARRTAEAALHKSEERFRTIAQATADAVWDWDVETDTVWWNEGAVALLGYTPERSEEAPETWGRRIHPDDRQRVLDGIRMVLEGTGQRWSDEYRFQRADGSYRLFSDQAFVIRNDSGIATRMIGSMRDVTVRREMEERLRQSHRLEAVGQLTGGVAHDFNNLLTVILGSSEELVAGLADREELRSLAEMILNAAQRGADLTRRLLAFGRRQALRPTTVDIYKLAHGMDALLRRTLGEQVEIDFVRRSGPYDAVVDAAQLEAAILNLAINARDAMPRGGRLTIEVATAHLDDGSDITPGDYVMVAVSDTGTGMAPDVLSRAFEPFFTTKDVGKGSGLGLSMVYGFVKQSGGQVKICSEPGTGTTVRLYFPCVTPAIAAASQHPTRAANARGSEKILLVEDDDLVRNHVAAQLRGLGYRVVKARNGAEAIEAVEREPDFDLLFTDIVMPGGMDGRQLADEVKKLRPDLPALLTSGYAQNRITRRAANLDGIQLLSKPYDRGELAAKIRSVLNDAKGLSSSRR